MGWSRDESRQSGVAAQYKIASTAQTLPLLKALSDWGTKISCTYNGTDIQASQGNTSYSGIEKSHGKVVKIEMRRDNKGHWVFDKLTQRSGMLFEQRNAFKGDSDSNSGGELPSGSDNNEHAHR